MLLDESGRPAPPGAIGEIAIRGPRVTAAYDNAKDNASVFSDGWFRTGDLGRFDADGYLFITGRLKEIVNRGGQKIMPREIDDALLEHPDVAQAVAFAAPHPTLGEDAIAAVVLRDGAITDELELRAFLINRLASFKVPSRILFVDAIPKGATDKVQRIGLYEKLAHLMSKAFVAPRNDMERSLALIFHEVLGRVPISVNDNFFSLGGDSLKGAQVLARIRTHHGVEIAVPTLFSCPTIATLAIEVDVAATAASHLRGVLEAELEQMSDEEVVRFLAQDEGGTSQDSRRS